MEDRLMVFMINDLWVNAFIAVNELEKDRILRAFISGLRWGRSDEFDPVVMEIRS